MVRFKHPRIWKGERVDAGDPVMGTDKERADLLDCGLAYEDDVISGTDTLKRIPHGQILIDAGYVDIAEVNEATDDKLLEIGGIGESRLIEIRNFIADDSIGH